MITAILTMIMVIAVAMILVVSVVVSITTIVAVTRTIAAARAMINPPRSFGWIGSVSISVGTWSVTPTYVVESVRH